LTLQGWCDGKTVDRQIWVEQGATPFIRKVCHELQKLYRFAYKLFLTAWALDAFAEAPGGGSGNFEPTRT
jgi:hypothetical protein